MAKETARRMRPSVRTQRPGPEATSSGSAEPDFLIVGQIVRPHGVRGDLAMKIITQYPDRLFDMASLYVGDQHKRYQVASMRHHAGGMILRLSGVTYTQAEALRGQMVSIHIKDAAPLEEGEYYLFQIEGIRVVTDTGLELGRLTSLIETGANDVYVVTTEQGKEVLLPAIPDVILEVNISEHVMTVHLLDGLLDMASH